MIMEHGYYSVISPEGCAAILWKDRAAAPQAADSLKFSPEYLKKFGVVDRVISEPMGGAHRDFDLAAKKLKDAIVGSLAKLKKKSTKKLLEDRYTKFRHLGEFAETETSAVPVT